MSGNSSISQERMKVLNFKKAVLNVLNNSISSLENDHEKQSNHVNAGQSSTNASSQESGLAMDMSRYGKQDADLPHDSSDHGTRYKSTSSSLESNMQRDSASSYSSVPDSNMYQSTSHPISSSLPNASNHPTSSIGLKYQPGTITYGKNVQSNVSMDNKNPPTYSTLPSTASRVLMPPNANPNVSYMAANAPMSRPLPASTSSAMTSGYQQDAMKPTTNAQIPAGSGQNQVAYPQYPMNQQQRQSTASYPMHIPQHPLSYPPPNPTQTNVMQPIPANMQHQPISYQHNQQKPQPFAGREGGSAFLSGHTNEMNPDGSMSSQMMAKASPGKYFTPSESNQPGASRKIVQPLANNNNNINMPRPLPPIPPQQQLQPQQPTPMNKAKPATNMKSMSVKDRDKLMDKDRYSDREESLVNMQRRRDIISMKLALIERRSLVGSKGPPPLTIAPKTKWDYVLNEAQWMAVDYHQELRWKLRFSQVVATLCKEHVAKRRAPRPLSASVTDMRQYISSRSSDPSLRGISRSLSDMMLSFWVKFQPDEFKSKSISTSTSSPAFLSPNKPLSSPSNSTRNLRSVHTSSSSVNPVGGLGIVLLDHQRNALNRVMKIYESGYGSIVSGRRLVGKTTLLVAAIDSWLSGKLLVPKMNNQVLLFASRRSCLRWVSEIERILPLRSINLWLPSSAPNRHTDEATLMADAMKASSSSSSFPSSDIVMCISELADDYIHYLQSRDPIHHVDNISGILLDIRGLSDWMISSSLPSSVDHWIQAMAKRFPNPVISRAIVCDDLLSATQLQTFSTFLDPSIINFDTVSSSLSSENRMQSSDESNDDGWKDWIQSSVFFPPSSLSSTTRVGSSQSNRPEQSKKDIQSLLVEVVIGTNVESFAAAQVREEVVSQDMDSLQHLKYFQVMDTLLSQSSFQGDNPWILAQALTLLRRVCFHEAFVSIGGSRKTSLNAVSIISDDAHKFISDDRRIGLGFGLTQASLCTGIPAEASRWKINPSVNGFCETIKTDITLSPISSSTAKVDTPILDPVMESLKRSMSVSAVDDQAPITRHMSSCFAPGPLSSKLASPARFNMNGNFYDSIGSCKLQVLCALIARFSGLRIVIVVSSIDEQLTVHNFLNRLGFDHTYAGLAGSKLNTPVSLDAAGLVDTTAWLRAQAVIQKFNRTSQTASALLLMTKDVFLQPGLLPWKADVVIMLSDDWITPTDIRSCFRLRLTSAGPSGDPVTVVRIVAKGTLEELVARRGSLLNLQGIALTDLFPAFVHTLQSTVSTGISSLSSMLYRAPPAGLVRKIRDISIIPLPALSPSPGNKFQMSMQSSSPLPSTDEALISCTHWLQVLRLGLIFAEFQFSRLGKFVPYSMQSSDFKDDSIEGVDVNSTAYHHMDIANIIPISVLRVGGFQSALKEMVADLVLQHYMNLESVIVKQHKVAINNASSATNAITKPKAESNSSRYYPASSLILRLIDARIRDMAHILSKRADEHDMINSNMHAASDQHPPTHQHQACLSMDDYQRLSSQGIGASAMSSTEQVFHNLIQPILPFHTAADIPREGRELQGPVISNSQGQNGTPFFRSSQLFRQVLAHHRRHGIDMDPHLYLLNQMQSASMTDHIIRGNSSDYSMTITLPDISSADKQQLPMKRAHDSSSRTKEESKSSVFNTMLKVDLTSIGLKIEFEPAVHIDQSAPQTVAASSDEITMKTPISLSRSASTAPTPTPTPMPAPVSDMIPVPAPSPQKNNNNPLVSDMINDGVEQSDRTDMERWLLSEDGLIVCIPALFQDASFELTTRLLNHVLRIRDDLTIAAPRSAEAVRIRYAQLIADSHHFQSKNAARIADVVRKLLFDMDRHQQAVASDAMV